MIMERYDRHIRLPEIGTTGQQKLGEAKVLVIGAGGLGCPVLQYLAAAGIGTLGIIDFDTVALSNLQRQVLFSTADVGKNKAICAQKRLADLNPDIEIQAYPYRLEPSNIKSLFEDYDLIVDGSDNFETRYWVNDACVLSNTPLVHGAIYKFEGQLTVFNHKNGPSYRCLFPDSPKTGSVPSCNEIGVLGVLPGIIGSLMANEVLKICLELGNPLSGTLLHMDTLGNQSQKINFKRNPAAIEKVLQAGWEGLQPHALQASCDTSLNQIGISEVDQLEGPLFLDVRESHEQPKIEVFEGMDIPLGKLENSLDQLPKNRDIVCFCQAGIRAQKAAALLQSKGFQEVYALKEGAPEILTYYKSQTPKGHC
ncbi:HesA/MoeB/ThiF family protein [Sediminicola luteus]|nr:HesA/MoeB/ThiF family protein [Sediminicola luteus]